MLPQNDPTTRLRTHISRPRLIQTLWQAIQYKLTVVCGDAGYGKTTLLADFTRATGFRSEWYHVSGSDRDVARLAEGLGVALGRLGPRQNTGNTRRTRMRHSPAPSVGVLSQALARQAARVGPELSVLIIDDYQNIEQEADVSLLLSSLIENAPQSLRFVVLSRSMPHLPFAQLSSRQDAFLLSQEGLAFTPEETEEFLGTQGGLHLEPDDIALIQDRTEGWAAGISMVTQSLRWARQEKVMSILSDPVASVWLVYDYLADEVFDRQVPEIQDFLVKTSILRKMTAGSCDGLLGAGTSELTLLELEDQGLFVTSMDAQRHTFRYHQLFREFLRQKLHQREKKEAIRELHLSVAQFYSGEGDWEECVYHYIKAEEFAKAAQVVESVGERYIFSGFSKTVEYWLRDLPGDVVASRPWLLALSGRLCHLAVRNEEATQLLERALLIFRTEGNEDAQAWTIGEQAYVAFRSGQLHSSIRQYGDALAMAKSSALRSQLLVMRALPLREAGMLEESVRGCVSSIEELAAVGEEAIRTWGLSRATRNLALAWAEMGDLESALKAAEGALTYCVEHHLGEYEQTWVMATLGTVLWNRGEFDKSIDALNEALDLSGRHIKQQQHTICLYLGNAYRDSGCVSAAAESYGQSARAAELQLLFLEARHGTKEGLRAKAVDLCRRYCAAENIGLRATAEVVLAAVLRNHGELGEALEHVREASRVLTEHGYQLKLASCLLHQARLEYELSCHSSARESLGLAFQISRIKGYYHFHWWDAQLVAFLCERALVDDIQSEYARDLAARRLDMAGAPSFFSLLRSQRIDVRRKASTILQSVRDRAPDSLALRVLAECGDPGIRDRITQAIGNELISLEGIQVLRSRHELSWRELDVLVEYYLRLARRPFTSSSPLARECAQTLCISENTVRCHVTSLRSKLGLPAWLSGRRFLDWAQQEGILPTSMDTADSAHSVLL